MAEESRATTSPDPNPADPSIEEPQETEAAPGSSEAAEGAKSGGDNEVNSSDKMEDGMKSHLLPSHFLLSQLKNSH